jgi:hypothetical protein
MFRISRVLVPARVRVPAALAVVRMPSAFAAARAFSSPPDDVAELRAELARSRAKLMSMGKELFSALSARSRRRQRQSLPLARTARGATRPFT